MPTHAVLPPGSSDTGAAAPGAPPSPPVGRRRRPSLRTAGLVAVVLVLLAAVAVGARYHSQLYRMATHLKGSPTHTDPYVPFTPTPLVHLAVAGDVGDSGSRLDATGAAIGRIGAITPFQALLLLGDNVYPSGNPARLPATVFAPFAPVLDEGTELLAILGNHDVRNGNGDPQMAALGMPGRYWARTYGDVLLVGLDSTTLDDPDQLAFLEDTLRSTDATWRLVALHHPPYSAGYQGSSVEVREVLAPMVERHGVQLVLSGHDHDYQRSVPIGGVTYVVSGAGAGTRRTGEDDFTAVSFSWHHFLDVGVFEDRLVLRAVNQDGRVADEAVLLPSGAVAA